MAKQRAQRFGELLKKEVSNILLREIKDPRIDFVSVTDVEVSNDLRCAKIYVSVFGDKEKQKDTMKGLEQATGFIRKLIGERIKVHHTPELLFRYDSSIAYGAHISELLGEIKKGEIKEKG